MPAAQSPVKLDLNFNALSDKLLRAQTTTLQEATCKERDFTHTNQI